MVLPQDNHIYLTSWFIFSILELQLELEFLSIELLHAKLRTIPSDSPSRGVCSHGLGSFVTACRENVALLVVWMP